MSREYDVKQTLVLWDYIFAGILETARSETDYDEFDLRQPQHDPFVNLEFLSVAMICLIRQDLLDSDLSMCLGLLMSYKVPSDPLTVIRKAQQIRNAYLYAMPYETPRQLHSNDEFTRVDLDEAESLDGEPSTATSVKRSEEQTPSNLQRQDDFVH